MTAHADEPQVPHRVTLEIQTVRGWRAHEATFTNLTRHEVWIGIDESLGDALKPEKRVRLVLRSPDGGTQTAETIVLWHIGVDGKVVVLMRPKLWDPPSRRAHSRARLTIPVYLASDDDSPPVPAWTTNVGVGGVYCVADVPIEVGRKLPLSLRLTPAESFECRAEVVRVDQDTDDPTGRQVVIALRFLDLGEDDQARLAVALAALADDVDGDFVPQPWRSAAALAERNA